MKMFITLLVFFTFGLHAAPPVTQKSVNQPLIFKDLQGVPYKKTIKGDFLGESFEAEFLRTDLWHFANPQENNIEGVSVHKTYKTYKIPAKAKAVIVAVIDSGVDVRHSDLQGKLWVNPKEVWDNGIDDDKNGYIDDIFGWNFIGNKLGMAQITDTDNDPNNGFKYEIGDSKYQVVADTLEVTRELVRMKKLAQSRPLNAEEAAYLKQTEEDYNNANDGSHYYDQNFNSREIVGDNYADLKEKFYGNNDVIGDVESAFHGTHVSGIIAANRQNDDEAAGVAENVKIMSLRVVPDGDERDKDVANAIYYAVDNGAQIINMSFGKSYKLNKKIVDEAVAYAESKGVLLVHAAGNSSANNDFSPNFPNRLNTISSNPKAEFTNWIEVAASGSTKEKLNARFSNFGTKTVDLFSPGVQIISLAPENKYAPASGTSMASPVTAGILAAILNFVPSASTMDAKQALLSSVRLYPSLEVVHAGLRREFATLTKTGGVADLFDAITYLKNKGHKVLLNDGSSTDPTGPSEPRKPSRKWGKK
jgi:cell wall-associated protease